MRKGIASSMMCAAVVAATSAIVSAQATWNSANVPQPHLAKARALAAEDNSWRLIGLVTCYPADGQPSQRVNKDPGGFRVFDNVAYVGHGRTGPYAIETSDGIILIDSMNSPDDVEQVILPNMRAVGMDPARLKVLIISHGHGDHYGGARYLQDKFGVQVHLSEADYALAERAGGQPNARVPAPRRDVVVKDGDTITLGTESIKVYITPGHTPGSLSMLIPVLDRGQPRLMAYFGGVTNRNLSAEMHVAFDTSWGRLEQIVQDAKPDGWLASHPNYDDAVYRIEQVRANAKDLPNPFVTGTASTLRFVQVVRECNLNHIDLERAMPAAGRGGRGAAVPAGAP
jgi:metallo-beta-lactamase class B